ncbi:MAG: PaaI family thioesterase [Polycyclovorans sp.]|uniref:PaaI family thioesterase n=1 Tax=Panacagrimonas sp. TaxID=2480088 RepID=UPI000C4E1561|nr:thioesterase [Polycyclovorans sp.]MBU0789439.1 PaaI family thioesterase [Gammaproteobacteria bacterium]MDP1542700.1 PaaI family thioesterase [Polycyclovorans sp.]MEC8849829.1 PaaI family thioesterase [Pseudomonadota bacterium]
MSDQPEVAPQIAELIKMFPQIGFQKVLGIEVVETVPDRAVVRLPHRMDLCGGGNALHGGVISSMLDLTGALAAWSGHDIARGMKASTVTLTVNFVGAAMGTAILATGEVRRRGKELIFCDVKIVEDSDARRLVATGSMIYRIV